MRTATILLALALFALPLVHAEPQPNAQSTIAFHENFTGYATCQDAVYNGHWIRGKAGCTNNASTDVIAPVAGAGPGGLGAMRWNWPEGGSHGLGSITAGSTTLTRRRTPSRRATSPQAQEKAISPSTGPTSTACSSSQDT